MRDLYVVAISDDGGHLVLAARPDAVKGSHRVPVDDRLRAALRGTLPAPGTSRAVESALSPKEIQARLRAGETPEQVARIAGVPVTRVLRYAGPVMSERARMVDEARAATMTKARGGPSALPLGEAVDRHLAGTAGLKTETVDWAARRRDDGTWVVSLSFTARGRSRTGHWAWDPSGHQLTSLDAMATRLGHVSGNVGTDPAKNPAKNPAKKPAKKPTRKPAKKAAKKAATKSTGRAAPRRTAAPRPAPVAPQAPLPKAVGVRPATDGKRAAVPTWSDVLLGTRTPAPADNTRRSTKTAKPAARRSRG